MTNPGIPVRICTGMYRFAGSAQHGDETSNWCGRGFDNITYNIKNGDSKRL